MSGNRSGRHHKRDNSCDPGALIWNLVEFVPLCSGLWRDCQAPDLMGYVTN